MAEQNTNINNRLDKPGQGRGYFDQPIAFNINNFTEANEGYEGKVLTVNNEGIVILTPGAGTPVSASYALSSSFALTASYFSGSITNAVSASYALTASYFSGSISNATSASYALSASQATSASYALSSSQATSASYAFSASYADTASSAINAQDILVYCKNQSGYTITKGMVVRITGSNNSSDIPRIVTASYENDNNSANTLGIANETITNGNDGYIMTEGILKGIDTNAYISGQLIYLGATGSITGSAPRAPLHNVRLGEVIRHQSNNGSIYVRIDNGYELGELHDVVDNTTTSSYGDLLIKSGSVWTNSKSLTGSYSVTGSWTVSGSSTFTNIGPAIFSGSVTGTSGFTGSFTGSLTGTSSYADQAGNSNTININSFSAPVESYLLMSNVVATTGVGIGGDSDLRYNSSTNVLTVPSIVSTFTGSFSGSFTGSFFGTSSWSVSASQAISSSWAISSSQAVSASYALSSSQAVSASFSVSSSRAVSSSFAISASRAVSASWAPIFPFTGSAIISGSLIVTGSTELANNLTVNGDSTLNGTTVVISPANIQLPGLSLPYSPSPTVKTVMFDTLNNALFVTSSLPGGTTSGAFTGSFTGSFSGSFTGSLFGTSSWSVSSSQAISSSWAISSSQAVSASYALSSSQAVSSSYALSSSQAISSSWAISSSRAVSASFSISSSQAVSASYALSSSQALSASFAVSSSRAVSASWAPVFPFTGSAQITGSLGVTGSISTTGNILQSTMTQEFISLPSGIGPGTTAVISKALTGPISMFIEYKIVDAVTGTNQRTGIIMANFNDTGTPTNTYSEMVTADIGNTSAITFNSAASVTPYEIQAVNSGINPYSFTAILKYF